MPGSPRRLRTGSSGSSAAASWTTGECRHDRRGGAARPEACVPGGRLHTGGYVPSPDGPEDQAPDRACDQHRCVRHDIASPHRNPLCLRRLPCGCCRARETVLPGTSPPPPAAGLHRRDRHILPRDLLGARVSFRPGRPVFVGDNLRRAALCRGKRYPDPCHRRDIVPLRDDHIIHGFRRQPSHQPAAPGHRLLVRVCAEVDDGACRRSPEYHGRPALPLTLRTLRYRST